MQYFIGQTRFSIYQPSSKAWNVSGFTEEEYLQHLFSDERMKVRMRVFADISVPLLALMKKDYEYYHIVAYSSHLPEKWKNELLHLKAKYSFLYLHEVDTDSINPLNVILEGKGHGSLAYFRLDDDDLLSVNYLDFLSRYTKEEFKNMAVSFGKGIVAHYQQGHYVDFRNRSQKTPSMGLAYIGMYYESKKIDLPVLYSHHNIEQHMPVILDSREISYLQTYHHQQDTHYRFSGNDSSRNLTVEKELTKFDRIKNIKEVNDNFPTLSQDLFKFVNERKILASICKYQLLDKNNVISINDIGLKNEFECEYNIIIPGDVSSLKAVVIAFEFDREVKDITGLMYSSYQNIGWFKYISSTSGTALGSLSFITCEKARLTGIKIIFWDNKIKTATINALDIL